MARFECPSQESNLDHDLRTVACAFPAHCKGMAPRPGVEPGHTVSKTVAHPIRLRGRVSYSNLFWLVPSYSRTSLSSQNWATSSGARNRTPLGGFGDHLLPRSTPPSCHFLPSTYDGLRTIGEEHRERCDRRQLCVPFDEGDLTPLTECSNRRRSQTYSSSQGVLPEKRRGPSTAAGSDACVAASLPVRGSGLLSARYIPCTPAHSCPTLRHRPGIEGQRGQW